MNAPRGESRPVQFPQQFSRLAGLLGLVAMVLGLSGCGGDEISVSLADLQSPSPLKNVLAQAGDRRVRISWQASNETDILGYNVLRSQSASGPFKLIGSTGTSGSPFFQDLGPDLNADGIPDGLVNGQRYFYRVSPFDVRGRQPAKQENTVVSAVPGTLPGGTTDLGITRVQAYGGNRRVILLWDLNLSSQVFGYFVYRSQVSGQQAFELLAMAPQGTNHFVDEGVTNGQDYRYEVAPVTRELLEGRRLRSRILRVQQGDDTVPKFPGHDTGTGILQVVNTSPAGVTLSWGRPTENSDGTLLGANGVSDDMLQGGFLIYRSRRADGRYFPVGMIDQAGSALTFTYTDPQGTAADFYTVRAFDRFGTLSAQGRRVAAGPSPVVPDVIRGVDAFAGTSTGQILVQWILEPTASVGYRVYRSEHLDRGFRPVSGVLPPAINFFTDSSQDLTVGKTFYYKVAGVGADAAGAVLEGNKSVAASAVPGPSDGVFYLEAENATVIAFSAGTDFNALSRQAFPEPFSGLGALFIDPSQVAAAGASFVTLQWSKEIDASGPAGGARSYDVYVSSIRNSSAGIFDLQINEPVQDVPVGGTGAFLSMTSKDFFSSQFGFPPLPTLERVGTMSFRDEDAVGGNPTNETINLTLVYQGFNPGIATGNGELFLDGLILVRR
jgi:hypothetical protein